MGLVVVSVAKERLCWHAGVGGMDCMRQCIFAHCDERGGSGGVALPPPWPEQSREVQSGAAEVVLSSSAFSLLFLIFIDRFYDYYKKN